MADGADVRSIDAVREWHASLATYGDGLAEALAGVELEIRRGYDWLEEQLGRWQHSIREREEEVTRAKAELSQRKFKTWDGREPDCTVQEKALRLAKARLEHAEDQVAKCRQWIARLPKMIDEVWVGPSRRLSGYLDVDLRKALTELARRVAALESYAELRPDYAPAPALSSAAAAPPPPPAAANQEGNAAQQRQGAFGRTHNDAPEPG